MAADGVGEGETVTLCTERLILRLADPSNPADCSRLLEFYTEAGKGTLSRVGIKSLADIQRKHEVHRSNPEHCTLAPPPRGIFFLAYLPVQTDGEGQTSETLIANVVLSTRSEMPYPDLGWGVLEQYQGKGYAQEAGRAVLEFWRDNIGVKEIYAATAMEHVKSQRCAERVGFVRAGNINIVLGYPPNEEKIEGAAFVLPGMEWEEGQTIYPSIGLPSETADLAM